MCVLDRNGAEFIGNKPTHSFTYSTLYISRNSNAFVDLFAAIHAVVTTTIRLRFDGRSTAYQRSLKSR